MPLGRERAGGLVDGDGSDQNFAWVLTDGADASNGLSSGRYAAVVTIPKNFSARATSYNDQSGDTAEQAVLDVQTSPVSGVSDPVIGQAITAAATRALNSQLTEQYVKNVYVGFNTTKKQFTKVADAAGRLDDGTTRLAEGLGQTSDGAAQLSDGLAQLDDGGTQLHSGAEKLSRGLDTYADGVSTLADQTATLPKGGRQLADGAQDAADGVDQLADGAAGLARGLKTYRSTLQAQADTISLPEEGRQTVAACLKDPGSDPTCRLILLGYQAGAKASLDGAASGITRQDPKTGESLLSGATALASGAKRSATGLQELADGTDELADGLKPLAAGIAQLDSGAAQLASGAGDLSTGLGQLTDGVHSTATGAEQLSAGLVRLSTGADQLADGTKQLSDGLATGAKQIPTYDEAARDRLSTVVATPVTTPKVTSVFSNAATTTLLAVLALWVGGLAGYLVLRSVSARALASMKSSWRLTAESLLPTAAVAAVQAVILTVLLTALLDLAGAQTARLLGLSLLAGWVFVALNQALVAWFGGVGRFVSVVMVVLTAAAALTSAVPRVFDTVTPLLPLTPALEGMRTIGTGSGSGGGSAALLVAWLVVGLGAGVLATARRRVLPAPTLVVSPAR